MQPNMGMIDRAVRIGVAVILAILIFANVVSGWLAIVLGIIAAVFLLTSIIGFCPLYLPFGINTGAQSTGGKGRTS